MQNTVSKWILSMWIGALLFQLLIAISLLDSAMNETHGLGVLASGGAHILKLLAEVENQSTLNSSLRSFLLANNQAFIGLRQSLISSGEMLLICIVVQLLVMMRITGITARLKHWLRRGRPSE